MVTKYFEFAKLLVQQHAAELQADPLLARRLDKSPAAVLDYSETLFQGATRRRMVYDRIPVGHDTGYRCYDGGKHDPDSAYQSGEFGDGLTENEAYVAWLWNIDDEGR